MLMLIVIVSLYLQAVKNPGRNAKTAQFPG